MDGSKPVINAVAALVWPFVLTLVPMAIDQNTALAEVDYTPFVEDIVGEETSQEPTGSAQAGLKSDPPFDGTVFIDPDVITPSDPSTLLNVTYDGRGERTMWDNRLHD